MVHSAVGLAAAENAHVTLSQCTVAHHTAGAFRIAPPSDKHPRGDGKGVALKISGCSLTGKHWMGDARPQSLSDRKNKWVDEDGFTRAN